MANNNLPDHFWPAMGINLLIFFFTFMFVDIALQLVGVAIKGASEEGLTMVVVVRMILSYIIAHKFSRFVGRKVFTAKYPDQQYPLD